MKINIHGDKIKVTTPIKDYVYEKLGKLDKYFEKPDEVECKVVIRVKNNLQTIEVTIPTSKFTIRCEEGHDDLYASIDIITDKLERMIRKNKTRLQRRFNDYTFLEMALEEFNDLTEEVDVIAKRKKLNSKPMSEDEAILQMELLNHDFFLFKNSDENCTSLLYKRKDNTYGLISIE